MAAIPRVLPISSFDIILRIPRNLQLSLNSSILFHKVRHFAAASSPPILHDFSHCFAARRRGPSKVSAGWFSGFGVKKEALPEIVKAGDPVLHEPAVEVPLEDIGSERIQKIIDGMIGVMRKAPGVGLAAPQIGIPLRIIVLEDTKEYISYAPKNETDAQERRPFDLLVIVNPKLEKKGSKTALFFEGCLSVDGYRALVERHLQVEVTGHSRFGQPIKIASSGWMARILQHEFDHLEGTIYVDKIVPRTFRRVENLDLPLPVGCPKPGVYDQAFLSL
ncbi:peptide deformylase 1A, chloroplastic isoform X2 [Phalaenopsis equestris]|uniref:peptide deformylase 1A, chloroplastic isoform X2 n=1 Tax=Phalaenopsis equestris TaxID=78828 RepID=UPI0009E23DD5|nr:peptide deformylase 1A, chloroplastic isoform X2 [Phalaenopsis equestris]